MWAFCEEALRHQITITILAEQFWVDLLDRDRESLRGMSRKRATSSISFYSAGAGVGMTTIHWRHLLFRFGFRNKWGIQIWHKHHLSLSNRACAEQLLRLNSSISSIPITNYSNLQKRTFWKHLSQIQLSLRSTNVVGLVLKNGSIVFQMQNNGHDVNDKHSYN